MQRGFFLGHSVPVFLISQPCFLLKLCFCCCFCVLVHVWSLILWRHRFCLCVHLCYSLAWVCDSDHCIRFSGHLQESPHAPWPWVDEKHEWQDSWLSEQLMKMVRREEDSKKRTPLSLYIFFLFLFKEETEDEEYRYVRRRREGENKE